MGVSLSLIVGLSLLVGAVAGWLAGGSLLRAGTVYLRWLWLAPLAHGDEILVRAGQEVPFWAGPLPRDLEPPAAARRLA